MITVPKRRPPSPHSCNWFRSPRRQRDAKKPIAVTAANRIENTSRAMFIRQYLTDLTGGEQGTEETNRAESTTAGTSRRRVFRRSPVECDCRKEHTEPRRMEGEGEAWTSACQAAKPYAAPFIRTERS